MHSPSMFIVLRCMHHLSHGPVCHYQYTHIATRTHTGGGGLCVLPSSATFSIGTLSSWAMKPMTEKMTKPAKILVALFVQVTIIVSLKMRIKQKAHSSFHGREVQQCPLLATQYIALLNLVKSYLSFSCRFHISVYFQMIRGIKYLLNICQQLFPFTPVGSPCVKWVDWPFKAGLRSS